MTRLAKHRQMLDDAVNELLRARAWPSRSEVICAAAGVVREMMIERSRELVAEDVALGAVPPRECVATIAFDQALKELGGINGQRERVVELQFYGGMTDEESAQVLGLSVGETHQHSVAAKGWITARMRARGELK